MKDKEGVLPEAGLLWALLRLRGSWGLGGPPLRGSMGSRQSLRPAAVLNTIQVFDAENSVTLCTTLFFTPGMALEISQFPRWEAWRTPETSRDCAWLRPQPRL